MCGTGTAELVHGNEGTDRVTGQAGGQGETRKTSSREACRKVWHYRQMSLQKAKSKYILSVYVVSIFVRNVFCTCVWPMVNLLDYMDIQSVACFMITPNCQQI